MEMGADAGGGHGHAEWRMRLPYEYQRKTTSPVYYYVSIYRWVSLPPSGYAAGTKYGTDEIDEMGADGRTNARYT